MRLKSLYWDRYRAFKDARKLDIAPATILIGKNGSGKSVISRLPLLLSVGLSENSDGPLSLNAGGVNHAASFQDFSFQRSSLPFTIGAEICSDVRTISFATTFRYIDETKSLTVERFVVKQNSGENFSIDIQGVDQLTSNVPIYSTFKSDFNVGSGKIEFSGLFPKINDLPISVQDALGDVLSCFRQALPFPSYLGPFREEPNRLGRMPSQSIKDLGPRGERALEFLADDRLRHGGSLTKQVSEWFENSMNQDVEVDVSGDHPRFLITDRSTGSKVSLADTGAGFAQVLPIVVQHLAYRMGRLKSTVLIVEQPELHLHPAAHGAVADLVQESSSSGKGWTPATCIVETHSEQFIMRIRRRIAEGCNHNNFCILSLGHSVERERPIVTNDVKEIFFDDSGNPTSWPEGVFEEALDDLTAMRKASRGQSR